MSLNWNEIKSRALLFSKTWADASNEDSEAKPFWIQMMWRSLLQGVWLTCAASK